MIDPCLNLWRAVISNALLEALHPDPKPTADLVAKRDADAWLSRGSKDFQLVCALAGLDHNAVSEAYTEGRIRREDLKKSGRKSGGEQ